MNGLRIVLVLCVLQSLTFAQTPTGVLKSYARAGQIIQIRIEPGSGLPVYVKLTPTRVKSQAEYTFIALARHPQIEAGVDYGRFLRNVQAFSKTGARLPVNRFGTNRWQISATHKLHHLTYEIAVQDADTVIRPPIAGARRRDGYVFINGALLGGHIGGHAEGTQRVELQVPPEWELFIPRPTDQPGCFSLNNVQELAQLPIAAGADLRLFTFSLFDTPHQLALHAPAETVRAESLSIALTIAKSLFNAPAFQRYDIFVESIDIATNGSSAAFTPAYLFPMGQHTLFNGDHHSFPRLLGSLLANYLRAWLSAARYFPEKPSLPDSMRVTHDVGWLVAGIADYLAARSLTQTGLWSKHDFLGTIAYWMAEVEIENVRLIDRSNPFLGPDGYSLPQRARGAVIALMLDAEILYRTRGRKRLDDGIRAIEKAYLNARTAGRPFPVTLLPHLVQEATGVPVEFLFRDFVEKSAPIPTARTLAALGLRGRRPAERLVGVDFLPAAELAQPVRQLQDWWLAPLHRK